MLRIKKIIKARERIGLDTRMHTALLDDTDFLSTLTEREGLQAESPDEKAYDLAQIAKKILSIGPKTLEKIDIVTIF